MTGVYDLNLVVLSVIVAAVASYTALDLAGRVSTGTVNRAALWLLGGSLSMGTGIWAMHFIGMLAFHLPIPIAFDPAINGLSWLIAVGTSAIALFVVGRSTMSGKSLSGGAAVMGVGISSMHYTGMAAMQMSPPIVYDPVLFIASVVVAIAASFAALWLAFELRSKQSTMIVLVKLGSAAAMGMAIAGMHYIGMAAANFDPNSICLSAQSTRAIDRDAIAALIAVAAFAILAATLVVSAWDAHRAAHAIRYAESMRSANEHLRSIALYDSLTGLPNRMLLEDRAQQAVAHAARYSEGCAIMFLDLDKFKAINDTFGHPAGDELLKAAAKRISGCLRSEDTVARTGGDEFIIVAGGLKSSDDAATIAGKVVEAMARPFSILGKSHDISCSIGIGLYPGDGRNVEELMANADIAMYRVKKEGRNGFRLFDRKFLENTPRAIPREA